ncbi:MAG: InlB B-repeat-containing protein, partial [Peptostreptococcaceae bacterium]|nr:InlB B-repeat-containing protein [Peptostreptococcaceae bacterium]
MNLNQSKKGMAYILVLAMVMTLVFGSGMFALKAFATVTPNKPIKNMPLNKEGTVVANWNQADQTLKITGNGKIDSEYWWELPPKFGKVDSSSWGVAGEDLLEAFTLDMSDEGILLPDNCQSLFFMFPGEIKMNPKLDTSNVTNMAEMFSVTPLATVDVSNWNISGVTRIDGMFEGAEKMNPDVSKWDVSNVKNVGNAFVVSGAERLDLSNWNLPGDCEGFESFLVGIPNLQEVKIKNFSGPVGLLTVDGEEGEETITINGFAAPYYVSTCDDKWNVTKTEGPYQNNEQQFLELGNYVISITPPVSKVKVTFDSHGGSEVNPATVEKGKPVSEPTAPTKAEHKFLGWFTEEEGGAKWNFKTGKVEEDMTLHAHWEKVKYQVKTNVTGGTATVKVTPEEASKDEKVKVEVTGIEEGKQIKSITADGKPVENGGSFTMPGKEVTVEVVLEDKPVEKVTVTFNSHGGSEVPAATVEKGKTVSEPTAPTKAEHKFLGWFTAEEGGDKWNFETGKVEKDMTLHAHWEKVKYQVKTNVTGGTATVKVTPEEAAKDEKVKVEVTGIE